MKVFVIQLLGIIFVTLIIGSIQSATADHLEPGIGLFKDEYTVETAKTEDSNYRVYLQTILRNADGQLIGVTHGPIDGLHGWINVSGWQTNFKNNHLGQNPCLITVADASSSSAYNLVHDSANKSITITELSRTFFTS